MPSAVGYQPNLATEMGELQERITSTKKGSVTSVQAIYVPADDLTDPAPATTFAHLDATTVLSRALTEIGIYPAVDPLASTSRILDPRIVGQEHYDVAQAVKKILQTYKDLQDIIAILGIDELSEDQKLTRGAGAKDSALPLAAVPRGRAVHRFAGTLRESRRHGEGLQGDRRRQVRRHPRAGLLHEGHDRRSAGSGREDEEGGIVSEANINVVKSLYEAFGRRDQSAIIALVDPMVEIRQSDLLPWAVLTRDSVACRISSPNF